MWSVKHGANQKQVVAQFGHAVCFNTEEFIQTIHNVGNR